MSTRKFATACRRERELFPLQPVRVKPMVRPTFVYDACIHEFERLNAVALREWYEITRAAYPAGPTYPEFLEIQHDTACEIEAATRTLSGGDPRSAEQFFEDEQCSSSASRS